MTGQEVYDLMRLRRVTQKALAEELGVTPQAVQKWLADKEGPAKIPQWHQVKMANMLGVPISALGPVSIESILVNAEGGGVAQHSGRDSNVSTGETPTTGVASSPLKAQLFYLIERVATEDYCKRQIRVLQDAERLMSGK